MMMSFYLWSLVSIYLSALLIFSFKYKHFLVMLISLEMMVLSLYSIMFMYFSYFYGNLFMCLLYLTMSVCEGALGLSVMVMIIRTHGSDIVTLFDSLW